MGALSSTSPIQNAAAESPTGPSNDMNDTKVSVEVTPKPRKFFKSRNSAPPAEIQQQQQMAMQQQQSYQNHQQEHNHYATAGDEEEQTPKRGRKKPAPKKEKVEKPPKPEKVAKPKKEKKVKVVKVKEVAPEPASESEGSEPESPTITKRGRNYVEPTRSSGRSRAKCVNYNEDAGEDEFFTRIDRRIVPRHLIPATATKSEEPEPAKVVETMEVPVPQQSPSLHPPIVLRISKVSEV